MNSMKTKVLIFGANGLLGSAVKNEFIKSEKHQVLAPRSSELDVLNYDDLQEYIETEKPKMVINCVGYASVDAPENDSLEKEKCFELNYEYVKRLAEICAEQNIILVHFSTDYIFDGYKLEGYDEEDSGSPLNVYGKSKWEGEQAVFSSIKSFYLVRISWIFGPNGIDFIDKVMNRYRKGKDLQVVTNEIGKPSYTLDIAKALLNILERKKGFGVYHLVNEGSVSWHEFTLEFLAKLDLNVNVKKINSEIFNLPAKRPEVSILNNNKCEKLRLHTEALEEYLNQYEI